MKKWLSVLLIMTLLIGLVGCGSEEEKSQTNGNDKSVSKQEKGNEDVMTLQYWTLFGGGDGAIMDDIVAQFNAEYDDIQVESLLLEWGEYYTKLITGVSAGKGPDIGISHTSKMPELIEEGAVIPIDTYAEKVGIDWSSFNQNILSATIKDGEHYAIPIDTHPQIMYYNKKVLSEIGMLNDDGTLKLEQSAEGFMTFLEEVDSKLPDDISTFSYSTTGDDPYRLWWALYHQLGGNGVLAGDLKNVNIDSTIAIEALEYMKGMYEGGYIPINLEDFYGYFQSGQAAIFMSGVWCTGIFEGTEGFEFGAAPMPTFYGDKGYTWGDSHTFVLPYQNKMDDEKAEGALTFMNYVAENGHLWAKAGHIPAKDSVVASEAFTSLPYRNEYAEVASDVVFSKQSNKNWAIKSALIRNIDAYLTDTVDAETAVNTMIADITDIISK